MKYLLAVVALILTQSSYAGSIYKCATSQGIVYQQSPCKADAKKLASACVGNDDIYSNSNGRTSVKFNGEDCVTKAAKIKEKADAVQAKSTAEWNAKSDPSIGMTTTQAENSRWGYPDKVNTTVTKNGTSEQWVYRGFGYLYFDNGVITSIQK